MGGPMDDVAENIRNERRGGPVDRNPYMDCERCGESFRWKDYWKPRIDDGRIENPHEEPFLCDSCHEEKTRLERREANNRSMQEFLE